jgi:hypothetical protein
MIHRRTKIIALIATALFLGSLLIYTGFTFLLLKHKETLRAEHAAVADAEMQKKSLSTLEGIVRDSALERETLHGYILEDERVIDLLSLIETIAAEQGAILKTNTLTKSPIDDTFEELRLTVSVEGSFDRIMPVLMLLETLPQQSIIKGVTFSKSEHESEVTWVGLIDISVTKYQIL